MSASHGGLAEILATGKFPGIFVRGSTADKAAQSAPPVRDFRAKGVDRADGTQFNRALGERIPVRGVARQDALKARGQTDLQDFKTADDYHKWCADRKPGPRPINREKVVEAIKHAESDIKAGRPIADLMPTGDDEMTMVKGRK